MTNKVYERIEKDSPELRKNKIKKFDKETHDLFDRAKFVAMKFLKKKNFKSMVNPDDYGVDLIVQDPDTNKTFYCEVEVKKPWKTKRYYFKDVHVLYKKKKHFTLDKPSYLMMFNLEMTHFLVIKDKDIISSNIIKKPTQEVPSGEFFYVVELDKVKFYEV